MFIFSIQLTLSIWFIEIAFTTILILGKAPKRCIGEIIQGLRVRCSIYADNSTYRYRFNGKENDDEAYGDDNEQDYGMRIYDPRLGRFLSVDPIARQYPELTPYQFASNTPIWAVDLDGLEPVPTTIHNVQQVEQTIRSEEYNVWEASINSLNGRPIHWWNHAKGYRNYWPVLKGITGEGIAKTWISNNFSRYGASGAFLLAMQSNSNQSPKAYQTEGTYDFWVNMTVVRVPMFVKSYNIFFSDVTGTKNNDKHSINMFIGNVEKFIFEVKTLNAKKEESNLKYTLHGFDQSINNALKNRDKTSVLILDEGAYRDAYRQDPTEVQSKYNRLKKAGGHLALIPNLHRDAEMTLAKILKQINSDASISNEKQK
jgi:RHS repeat-associated protein